MDYQDFIKKDSPNKAIGGYHIIFPRILAQHVCKKKQRGSTHFIKITRAVEIYAVTDETYSCPKENAKKVVVVFAGKTEQVFVDPKYLRVLTMIPDIILE